MGQRGRSAALGATPDGLRESFDKLGDANMQDRALGWGKPAHGNDAGKQDAVWATVKLVAGTNVYRVSHTLRHRPGFAKEWESVNTTTPASHYSVIPWLKEKWNDTTCFVRVDVIVGNLAGGVVTLLIGGE